MDTTTSAVATVVVTAVGQWSKGKKITIKLVVGGMVLAISLAALDSANSDLAQKFAALILVAVLLTYAIPITKKLGFTK